MRGADLLHYTLSALRAHGLRSALTLLGFGVGIAAVILLTSIGEGLHRFVLGEFSQFGTNILTVTPGRIGARGGPPGVPTTARPLTLADAAALVRVPWVTHVSPAVNGNTEVRAQGRTRSTLVMGAGPDLAAAFAMEVAEGQFLPAEALDDARPLAVLGATVRRELFGTGPVLGERVQIGSERYRVVGVMAAKGQFLGNDLDDIAYIPASRALALFDRPGLTEIHVVYRADARLDDVRNGVRALLSARHGVEDFTLTAQEDMLASLKSILSILTVAVGALGGISLAVGAVGILTIMTIAVSERTHEIGLLGALGARRRTILTLFMAEAVLLALLGGAAGLALGIGVGQLIALLIPALPVSTPWHYALAAVLMAALIGLLSGVLPARQAARLDSVTALRGE